LKDMQRIAIDGPGGAGKSTVAKLVARELDIDYVDTGAMYRAVAYKALQKHIPPGDETALADMLADTDIDFSDGNIMLDGNVVDREIRTPEVSSAASDWSAYRAVREKLVALQRNMGERKSIVMDGRDIGTNVLKDAEHKFFLTASAEERARRRYKELRDKGQEVKYEDVLKDIEERDRNDTTRKLNPLKKALDAVEIDTTGMTIEAVVKKILEEIR